MLLGYVNDLRSHPIRTMLSRGIQITLNSGHPGIFGYNDVSFDYLASFLAWDLSIRDLKKLAINGITYSS
jgi:adenosine deaminase